MKRNIFFRPRTENNSDILLPGNVYSDGKIHPALLQTEPKAQHLGCFAGGMVGLASRVFQLPKDLEVARALVEGCLWGYESSASGIMPEVMHTAKCPSEGSCRWDEDAWHKEVAARVDGDNKPQTTVDITRLIAQNRLTPGITSVDDRRYILRPEAIESIFILYRLTGDASLMDRAWGMFESIIRATKTEIAHAALDDCTAPNPARSQTNSMESFWLAETLKYFYLIFDSPDVISLDEFVLNTEAHPLRRPI
jgi:mannosyl-oligosaccharide alpha-1,2-mannosidase